jgi:SAM-dependent methyltransferase
MAREYAIAGGRAGKERLDVLHRAHGPFTCALLDSVGIKRGARCLDAGCGGGHVSRELAARVGQTGAVVGIDLDEEVLELSRSDALAAGVTNVEFRAGDATELDVSGFDVVFARFLLSHVRDADTVVTALVRALKPGGVIVVEDTDISGVMCHPPSVAFDRFVQIYIETIRRRGGNADVGRMLPALLTSAGLADVGVSIAQPVATSGDVKLMIPLTLERIVDSAIGEGVADSDEIADTIAELYAQAADPTTLMSSARVIQAWATKPDAAPSTRV